MQLSLSYFHSYPWFEISLLSTRPEVLQLLHKTRRKICGILWEWSLIRE